MSKVLISFVGRRDPFPYNGEGEGAIVTLAREIKPDEVLLFTVYDPLKKDADISLLNNLNNTIEWLVTDNLVKRNKIESETIRHDDPRDYEKILPELRKRVQGYFEYKSNVESFINLSSGTSQQETSFLLLTENGYFSNPKLYQISSPEYQKNNKSRCKKIEFAFYREERLINYVKEIFSKYNFKISSTYFKEISDITLYSDRKLFADFFSQLSQIYYCWDKIKYREAFDRLNKLYNEFKRIKSLKLIIDIIKKQINILSKLKNETEIETRYNLVDLYYNSLRAYHKEDYTQVLSRFYRLVEGTFYYQLRSKYKVEPTDLYKSKNNDNKNLIKNKMKKFNKSLTFHTSQEALGILNDSNLNKFICEKVEIYKGSSPADSTYSNKNIKSYLKKLRKKRNDSIAAHGMRPVSWYEAKNSLSIADCLLKAFDIKDYEDQDYPFSLENLKIISEFIKSI